jgi:hypothetical protein
MFLSKPEFKDIDLQPSTLRRYASFLELVKTIPVSVIAQAQLQPESMSIIL